MVWPSSRSNHRRNAHETTQDSRQGCRRGSGVQAQAEIQAREESPAHDRSCKGGDAVCGYACSSYLLGPRPSRACRLELDALLDVPKMRETMLTPFAIDLYCGLGGWTEGLLAEGYEVVGFDIERHDYGTGGYPAQLVLQDALTLHGSQFKDTALIVANPPDRQRRKLLQERSP